ncbi:peptidoglycan D,D-transpeptidase FtsI family protein [Bacillus sp. es.036]|uniref:peptidoglycan D,D-transpeptidase FtsI family protein n=1 Tax=Bacillus sp. es.036 TaxID=1761764 RepID=UPI000BF9D190|nr:penicillin-binding protein 2 [Bacillus sp. es.036]PFG14488.1 cell division protein FtsI/penicillin-binding protein 2 [Bacillus sp. es.036]
MNSIKKEKRSHLPYRLNILFLFVFLLFSVLIFRLGYLQLAQGDDFENQVEETDNVEAKTTSPRGMMFDRYGRVVVDNKPTFIITYTKTQGTTQQEKLEVAEHLSKYIEKGTEKLTERDLKDYWIITRPKEARSKLSDKETKDLSDKDAYQLQLDRIKESDLNKISKKELEIAAIKREMDGGYALSSQTIKQDLTKDEIAEVSEHLSDLPGIEVAADAIREYPYNETIKTLLGNTGQIAEEEVDAYLQKGYGLNDSVGISFLERQYEEYLRGQPSKTKFVTDKEGNPIGDPEEIPGSRGGDLVLTLDMELQQSVDEILKEEIQEARSEGNYSLERAYAVMMEPKTGEVLAASGQELTNKGFEDRSYGAFMDAYAMGSTVKAATVLTGFHYRAIQPNTYFYDTPLYFPGTEPKKSYVNMGSINELTALQRSSNVYMFNIAMEIANHKYEKNQGGAFDIEAYSKMRNVFSRFGLGVSTGVDIPSEATGYEGNSNILGNLLDLSIGQFDTYTPIQMVQYISTVANDGRRMEAHLLKEVHEANNGDELSNNILYQNTPNVMNTVNVDQKYFDVVKKGLWMVTHTNQGTANFFSNKSYNPSAKTGTAEFGEDNYNLTLVGYAPSDEPEVAFAVVVPDIDNTNEINHDISERIMDKYFEMKKSGHQMEVKDKGND